LKKEKKAQAKLEYQAKHNSLTGLLNRFAISQVIGSYIEIDKVATRFGV
jgi:GGDEF domain-containing protein